MQINTIGYEWNILSSEEKYKVLGVRATYIHNAIVKRDGTSSQRSQVMAHVDKPSSSYYPFLRSDLFLS